MSAKKYLEELHRKEAGLKLDLKNVQDAIEASQKICDHKYKWIGNDSHHDFEECEICKHRIKI